MVSIREHLPPDGDEAWIPVLREDHGTTVCEHLRVGWVACTPNAGVREPTPCFDGLRPRKDPPEDVELGLVDAGRGVVRIEAAVDEPHEARRVGSRLARARGVPGVAVAVSGDNSTVRPRVPSGEATTMVAVSPWASP